MRRLTLPFLGIITLVSAQAFAAELKYNIAPKFFEIPPGGQPLGPTHGGAVIDKAGNIYITTDTPRGIVVFSPDGKFQRSFGPPNIHGLEIREENGTEVIYGARPNANEVIKLKMDGTQEWSLKYPVGSGVCLDKDGKENEKGFHPCAVTVGPDGSIYAADGYGSNHIFKFDKDRKFVKAFGAPGPAPGYFKTCHGIALDTRGEKPLLFVCNRNNNRVEHWDLDGNFVKIIQDNLRMPAAVHIKGEYAIVPELQGRVTVIDKSGAIVAQVGDNPTANQRANFGLPEDQWSDGITNSPHGASMDKDGNLIVSEWSKFGHLHKFVRQN
jgi:DNA-binding beta-propeller fold protein YncE